MKVDVKFAESKQTFSPSFHQFISVDDGGYDKGYADGEASGYTKGHADGYATGLAQRSFEVWTITLTDGSTVEKEVALL